MHWYNGWAAWWMMIMMTIFWLVIVGGLVWGAYALVKSTRPDRSSEDARRILDIRLAKGEISANEYADLTRTLEGH